MDGHLARETFDASVTVNMGGGDADSVPVPPRTATADNGVADDGLETAFDLVGAAIGAFLDALN